MVRKNLLRMSVGSTVAALLITCAAFILFDFIAYQKSLTRNLFALAEIVSENVSDSLLTPDRSSATRTLSTLRHRPSLITAAIYDVKGRVITEWIRPGVEGAGLPPPPADGSSWSRFTSRSLTIFHPITHEDHRIGMVGIQSNLVDLVRRFTNYGIIVVVVLLISMVISAIVADRVGRTISRPIQRLTDAARLIAEQKNYSLRVLGKDPGELGLLTRGFNQMLDRIEYDAQSLNEAMKQIRHMNLTLEERVRDRTAQLTAMNQELEAFSYSVSHDLRAPLRAIDGFSREMMESETNHLDEQGKKDLSRIRAAAKRMSQLIDDLLELSRLSRTDLQRQSVNLSVITAEVIETLRQADGTKPRSVHVEIEPDIVTSADPHLVRVILDNLLNNAWKFTSKKEQAQIQFSRIEQNGHKVYSVRDNGAGFNMKYAENLFGVFQRFHTPDQFPGTGVGLALVQRIVHRHGGRIWAEAEEGRGAAFFFTLS